MSRQDAEKTISFSVQAVKVTAELLKEMCRAFLDSPPKHGKIRYGDVKPDIDFNLETGVLS